MKVKQKLTIGLIRLKFKLLNLVSAKKAAAAAFNLFCTPLPIVSQNKPAIFGMAEKLFFNMDGLKIKGYRWGHGKAGRVLILHGFSSRAYKFHPYVQPLINKGYEVLAFDAPAHGCSEGKTINAAEYCQLIENICANFGPVDGYIAHSFGGIALSLAMEKIQHSSNTKIVFIAPATETSNAANAAFKLLNLKGSKVRAEFDAIIFKKSGHPISWFSINRAISNISAKVLWVHDENDDVTPLEDALPTREKQYPNIEFMITSGLGHRKIYHDKKVQKKIIEFL